jgi:hypothetical protein
VNPHLHSPRPTPSALPPFRCVTFSFARHVTDIFRVGEAEEHGVDGEAGDLRALLVSLLRTQLTSLVDWIGKWLNSVQDGSSSW